MGKIEKGKISREIGNSKKQRRRQGIAKNRETEAISSYRENRETQRQIEEIEKISEAGKFRPLPKLPTIPICCIHHPWILPRPFSPASTYLDVRVVKSGQVPSNRNALYQAGGFAWWVLPWVSHRRDPYIMGAKIG